jgi:hypothetical protein
MILSAFNYITLAFTITAQIFMHHDISTEAPHKEYKVTELYAAPNPSSGFFTIHLPPAAENESSIYFTIIDLTGKTVLERYMKTRPADGRINVDLSTVGAGVYFVKMKWNRKPATLRVVVH